MCCSWGKRQNRYTVLARLHPARHIQTEWFSNKSACEAIIDSHMPATPDALFEDCTLIGPDNAVQIGFPDFKAYTRLQFKNCRLIVLNFSQPNGVPSTGTIYSDIAGKYLHVDMENCVVAGYKVFGARNDDMKLPEVSAFVPKFPAVEISP